MAAVSLEHGLILAAILFVIGFVGLLTRRNLIVVLACIEIMLNAAASEPESILFCVDIKNFYLGTPMPRSGFMRIKRDQIPKESWDKYNLEQFADGDSVMMEITKGIYGLPEAGKLAHERLKLHLAAHGYHQAPNTTCLFRH